MIGCQNSGRLAVLAEGILQQNLSRYQQAFCQYIRQLEKQLLLTRDNKDDNYQMGNNNNKKRLKANHNNNMKKRYRVAKQLQLPFEMYLYSSSCDDHSLENQSVEKVFSIEGSSQASLKCQQQELDNKAQLNMQGRVFSFAKQYTNKRAISNTPRQCRNILDELFKPQPCSNIQQVLTPKQMSQLIQKYTQQYLHQHQPLVQQKNHSSSYDQTPLLIEQQLSTILSPYYTSIRSHLTNKLTEEYIRKVYIPLQQQRIDELLYFKQQQLEIKRNQLATLQGLLQETRGNRHVHQLMSGNSIQRRKHYQQQKKRNSIKIDKVPSLNLNVNQSHQPTYNANNQHHQHLHIPLTQRQNDQSSNTQRSLTNNPSKPGRTYHYQNNQYSSKQSSIVSDNNRRQSKYNHLEKKASRARTIAVANMRKQNNIVDSKQELVDRDDVVDQLPFRQMLQKFIVDHSNKTKPDNPQTNTIGLLELRKLQLLHQQKESTLAVMTFQIEYIKAQLDRVQYQQKQLKQQYQDKYQSLQLSNRLNYLQTKKQQLKKKLKNKIKLFWKNAHNNNIIISNQQQQLNH